MTPTNDLTNRIILAVESRFPGSRVWRQNRVEAMALGRGKPRHVSAGIDGQGDITGVLAPSGRRIEIEVKAGKDRQSDSQKAFERMIRQAGGIYVLARSVEQCLADIKVATKGKA
jgi:hypothetical protein